MYIVSPLVFRHVPRIAALVALAGIAIVALALLAYAAMALAGIDLPRLDGPELAPFRWTTPDALA